MQGEVVTVPGALEIPAAIVDGDRCRGAQAARLSTAVVALGCVIRGETCHFEHRGERVGARPDGPLHRRAAPLGNGILTVDTEAQALVRAGSGGRNKGASAAKAALAMSRSNARSRPRMPRPAHAQRQGGGKATARAARLAAVQALYQMELAGNGLNEILGEFESHWIGRRSRGCNSFRPTRLFPRHRHGRGARAAPVDPLIDEALAKSWRLERIEAVLRAMLRAGAYELDHRRDVPGRVVIGVCRGRGGLCRARRNRHGQCRARSTRAPDAHGRVRPSCRVTS